MIFIVAILICIGLVWASTKTKGGFDSNIMAPIGAIGGAIALICSIAFSIGSTNTINAIEKKVAHQKKIEGMIGVETPKKDSDWAENEIIRRNEAARVKDYYHNYKDCFWTVQGTINYIDEALLSKYWDSTTSEVESRVTPKNICLPIITLVILFIGCVIGDWRAKKKSKSGKSDRPTVNNYTNTGEAMRHKVMHEVSSAIRGAGEEESNYDTCQLLERLRCDIIKKIELL